MRTLRYIPIVAACVVFGGCLQQRVAVKPVGGLETLDFRRVVAEAKDKVFPAVVFVKVLKESYESGKKIIQDIAGSGVIVSPSGEVVTNWHVVDKAVEIRCLLYDGTAADARLVGSDKDTDLALVQLELDDSAGPLPYAELGESAALEEGDFVMAMGAPWGLNRSVSIGIISCTRRFLPDRSEYSLWLQTDAAISPGNSGGPLVNTAGKVVGINTYAAMIGGDMGFAVPADTIRFVLDRLRDDGQVSRGWTGLQLQPLKDFNRNVYFEGSEGVIVGETDPDSPARRAGLKSRDRILKVNSQAVDAMMEEDLPAVRRLLASLPKDTEASFEIRRADQTLTITLSPREKGKVEGEELDCPRWDLTLKTINQFDNPDLYFYRKRGLFVFGVKRPGNAANAGLRTGDIILKIDGQEISTLEQAGKIHAEAIANVEQKHRMLIGVLRNGLMRQIILDFARDYEKR